MLHVKAIIENGICSSDLRFLFYYYQNVESSLKQSTKESIEYASNNFGKDWEKLQSIDGIGKLMPAYIIAEVHPASRFANEKKPEGILIKPIHAKDIWN